MEPQPQAPVALAALNIYRTVREVLESAPIDGIDRDQLVMELRTRGFPHMGPRAAFEIVGRRLPTVTGPRLSARPEVIAVLRRLEAEVDLRAGQPMVSGVADVPDQRRAQPPTPEAPETATRSGPRGPRATEGDAPERAAAAAASPENGGVPPVPAGLAVTLRVLLRDGPASVTELHARLATKGWSGMEATQVQACLEQAVHWFEAAEDGWCLASESARRAAASTGNGTLRGRDSVRPAGDVSVFARDGQTTDGLLRPEGDEWALPGLPEEPHLQHVYLVRYRAVRQRQSGLLEVWIAGKGELYHFDRDCNLLRGGQAVAVARGQGLSWVRSVSEHEAQRLQRQSCSRCAGGTGSGRRR